MDIYRLVRNLVLQWLEDNLTLLRSKTEEIIPQIVERIRQNGYRIDGELIGFVSSLVEENARFVRDLIHQSAFKAGKILGLPENKVKETIEEIERFVYPDGLNLPKRLFIRKKEIERAFKDVLFRNIKLGESAKKIAYEFQYTAERISDEEFVNLLRDDAKLPKLVKELERIARQVVKGEVSREKWEAVIRQYERYIEERSRLGTFYSHKTLLRELTKAVENLSEEAIEDAVRWWAYNKQLYYFERIARTEVANTYHLAIIKQTEEDEFVIGYRWELSPAHERPDICDVYASVNFGLGKGVWPKKRVPRRKAHPHCTCLLIPVEGLEEEAVKKEKKLTLKEAIKQNPQGFEEWLKTRKWAWELYQKGVPIEEFFDEKHLRLKTRKELKHLLEKKDLLGVLPYKQKVNVGVGDPITSPTGTQTRVRAIFKDFFGNEKVLSEATYAHILQEAQKRGLKKWQRDLRLWGLNHMNTILKDPDEVWEDTKKGRESIFYVKKVQGRYVAVVVGKDSPYWIYTTFPLKKRDSNRYILLWRKQ